MGTSNSKAGLSCLSGEAVTTPLQTCNVVQAPWAWARKEHFLLFCHKDQRPFSPEIVGKNEAF